MANDLSASKLVDYTVKKALGKDALGSGKLVGYSVLSSGIASLGCIALISMSTLARPSAPPQR